MTKNNTTEEMIHRFANSFALQLNPSNDTMEAVRLLRKELPSLLTQARLQERKDTIESEIDENTSDGYHTFKELYEYRLLYNAVLFNEWAEQGKYDVHKSERHGDGELAFGGGWFIVMATLPTGQISNHYEMKDWDLFKCEAREKADNWDGHSPKDVATRLRSLASSAIKEEINKDIAKE